MSTRAQLLAEIITTLAAGQPKGITAAQLQAVLNDMVNSSLIPATDGTPQAPLTFSTGLINSSGTITTYYQDPVLLVAQAIGSPIKAESMAMNGPLSTLAFVNGTAYYTGLWLPTAQTLTGAILNIQTNGNYTANSFNGVGLYTYDGTGNIAQVAVSANTPNAWAQGTGFVKVAFTGTYLAAAGLFFVGVIYNSSAHVTNPIFLGQNSSTAGNPFASNSACLFGGLAGQTNLASPTQALSALNNAIGNLYCALY